MPEVKGAKDQISLREKGQALVFRFALLEPEFSKS
jgi:hypothetical protein